MEKGLVTVVLPVYKTEKYLNQCIESVVSQIYSKLEILLIDDGSPDICPQICDAWAKKDARIRVIHKENQGLGMARNTGIENAAGEYICFFDSDDYIAPDTVEKVYGCLKATGAEVTVFGYYSVDQSENIFSEFTPEMECPVYAGDQVQAVFLPELIAPDERTGGKRRLYMSACMMMYSMELIRRTGWRFVSERTIISEDVYSLLELFGKVSCVSVLPEALYYYRTNPRSLSRSYKPNRYAQIRHFYLECIAVCHKNHYSEKISNRLTDPFLAFTIAAIKQEASAPISVRQRLRNIQHIVNDETLHAALQNKNYTSETLIRKLLFRAMRHRRHLLCYCLAALRNHMDQ